MIRNFIRPIATKAHGFKSHIPTKGLTNVSLNQLRNTNQFTFSNSRGMFNRVSHSFSYRNRASGWYNRFNNYLNRLPKPLYYYILGINAGIFLMMNIPIFDRMFLVKNLACSPWSMSEGRIWTLVTSGFTHVAFWHVLFNGITFFFFGR